jgi:carboxymethylenebutenolidase
MTREALLVVTMGAALASPALAQDWARQRLEASPRHGEWVTVKSGERTVHAFVVFPETKGKAAAVVAIHENRGLTDWVRLLADELAAAGVIAIAPDLLSGAAPGGGRTSDFASEDAAREGISKLGADQVTADLQAVADYAAKLPASSGKVAVAGFCWGGGQAFRFATNRKDLRAAYVFYGSAPQDEGSLSRIQAPVYGFYGGADARIGATVPPTSEAMKKLGKAFEPVTYEGAGHGFMRAGEEPGAPDANKKGRDDAWVRWKDLLKKL